MELLCAHIHILSCCCCCCCCTWQAFEGASQPGFIKADKLLVALTTYGQDKISSEQAAELISQLEPDQNGNINYVEYVNMMMAE